jgi:predicted TIM-barrel fold metal-dependent hydrolase
MKRGVGQSGGRAIVDVHSHSSMQLYHDLIRDFPDMGSDQRFPDRIAFPPGLPLWTPEQALETMERNAIRAQILSLPDVTLGLRGETATRWARRFNEAMAEIVAKHPRRFGAFAVIPHDDMDASLREIDYALDVLKLDGIATSTNIRGTYIGDPSFDPWMSELHRRSAILFIHPTMPTTLNPVVPPVIEFSFDTARMVMNMVLTGAKRRFSNVKVISTHGGGAIPAISHRLEIIQPFVSKGVHTTEQIHTDLRSFYYDLTSCMGDVPLAAAARFVDPSKLLMGFDYPYAPEPMMQAEIARFFAFDGMSDGQKAAIAGTNALALFPRMAVA